MKKIHLFWIIPLILIIGYYVGEMVVVYSLVDLCVKHPVMGCIINMESKLNIDDNLLPFTKESQRETLSQRCMEEFYDLNYTYKNAVQLIK